jgi:dienelactone hydrolase
MKIATLLITVGLCLIPAWVAGQPLDQRALAVANQGPDLQFPDEAKELSSFSPLAMAIYRPNGAGPFPALVIVHSCGGLRQEIRDWTKLALERGYVAFVIDSLGPRGFKNGCYPPNWVPALQGAKDAFQALGHLRKFPFVDRDRVGLVGFSWGATVGLLASSRAVASQLSPDRYAAVVGLYPACYFAGRGQLPEFEFLRGDVDKPLLVLMGDQDTETPPAYCLPRLEALKQKGMPVEWHLYQTTTHCWDCSSLHNLSKTDFQGNRVIYRYDRQVTHDSAERLFAFLAKHLKADR